MDPATMIIYEKLIEAKKQIDDAIESLKNSPKKVIPKTISNLNNYVSPEINGVNGVDSNNGDSIASNDTFIPPSIVRSSNESLKINGEIEHVPSQKPVKNLQIQAGSIMLSFVYSSRNFFVNLQHDKMIEFYVKFNQDYFEIDKELIKLLPYEIIIDRIYAVFNPADESYYRAKVLDFIPNDSVRITFIDYGEEMDFEKQNLFKLLPPYDKEPPFALNCFIDGMIFVCFIS